MPRRLDLDAVARHVSQRFGLVPVSRQALLLSGLSRSQLAAAVTAGVLVRERRGVLRLPEGPTIPDPPFPTSASIRRRALAALAPVDERAVVSGDAAAVLRGLPIPARQVERITAIRPGAVNFDGPDLRLRGTHLPAHHIDTVDGIRVTSLERTALDVARGRSLPQALIVLDAAARELVALATGLRGEALRYAVLDVDTRRESLGRLDEGLAEMTGWPGTVAVRTALPHVRPSSESPAESISRGWLIEAGLVDLEAGVPVSAQGRTFWADLLSRDRRVIGEVDGWAKYGDSPSDFRASLTAERDRQRLLEDEGWRFVRWTLEDGRDRVIARMRRALSG